MRGSREEAERPEDKNTRTGKLEGGERDEKMRKLKSARKNKEKYILY